jgi:hypothetical protein
VKRAEEEERGWSIVVCSSYRRKRWRNEGGAAAKLWVAKRQRWSWSGRHRRSLGADVQTVRLTSGPTRFQFFSYLSKTDSNFKIEMDALYCSRNSQFLYEDSL